MVEGTAESGDVDEIIYLYLSWGMKPGAGPGRAVNIDEILTKRLWTAEPLAIRFFLAW